MANVHTNRIAEYSNAFTDFEESSSPADRVKMAVTATAALLRAAAEEARPEVVVAYTEAIRSIPSLLGFCGIAGAGTPPPDAQPKA